MSFCISRNCFTSRLTSGNVVPEPAAMRRRRELLRMVGSRRSGRVIARMIASVRLRSPRSTAAWASPGEVAHPGDHRHDLPERAHLLHLLHRLEHVIEGETALAQLLLELGRLLLVDVFLGALDEGQDVAHAEDAAGEAVRMEDLERVGLLAGAEELDRDAGDRRDRESGAAAGVAVDLGQDQAGDRHGGDERLGDGHGLLAGHRVHHEERLDRMDGGVDRGDLGHQRLVDRQAAGRVEDDDVADLAAGRLDAVAHDVDDRRPGSGAR